MAGEGRSITFWTALCGLIGGFLGSGAEGLLKWAEFREHLSETQQQQVLQIVQLATDLDKNHLASAAAYIKILSDSSNLPEDVSNKLVLIVTQSATSGPAASPQVVAQVTETFPQAVTASPALRALILPGHPRLYIQIAQEDQRTGAEKIREGGILPSNVDMPGVELKRGYSGRTELRYFFEDDKAQAVKLAQQLNSILSGLACVRVGGYTQQRGVKPELFELWIGPQATIATQPQSGRADLTCS